MLGVSLILMLALISYHSSDPSINNATDEAVRNWMGRFGASMSDMMLKVLGLGSSFVVMSLLAWGWRLGRGERLRSPALRICMLCVTLAMLTLLFAFIPTPTSWPIDAGFGGAMGKVLRSLTSPFIPSPFVVLIAFSISLMLLPLALGLKRKEWRSLMMFFLKLFAVVRVFFAVIFNTIKGEITARDDDDYAEPTYSKPKKEKSFLNKLIFGNNHEDDEERAAKKVMADALRNFSKEDDKTIPSFFSAPQVTVSSPSTTQETKPTVNVVRSNAADKKPIQGSLALAPKFSNYEPPSLKLLKDPPTTIKKQTMADGALKQNSKLLESVLSDFGVKGEITNIRPGPVVTLYELEAAAGTRVARVIGLADDIARNMSAVSARISAIAGRSAIGIELPNRVRETVYLREMLANEAFASSGMNLPMALGKDISGEPIYADLSRMPHLLVAGTTGSGKSVCINTMILSLVYALSPEQCKFIMIDPKMLELSIYDGIPHLLAPVVTDPAKAVVALKWAVKEMINRNELMSKLKVRNIDAYNKRLKESKRTGEILRRQVQTGFDPETGKPIYEEQIMDTTPLPFIVVIVDEMADLMLVAGKEVENAIQRLAQMARAAGIHIIMATQRPSADVITGVIRANFPTRISFQVTSKIDSRVVLSESGAEQLLGMGDMLYMMGGGRISRVHGPFASDKEVEEIVNYLKTQGEPQYVDAVTYDEEAEESDYGDDEDESDTDRALYDQAIAIVVREKKASTSLVQRHLRIGYNRAARLIEKMEREGVISQANHVGKREILARVDD